MRDETGNWAKWKGINKQESGGKGNRADRAARQKRQGGQMAYLKLAKYLKQMAIFKVKPL